MSILATVQTDMFNHTEVKPNFVNSCCFGEDFAAWLSDQISDLTREAFEFSKAIQEDYGWGFWVYRGRDQFWVAISYVGSGPRETPAQWVISVNYDAGLNLVKKLFYRPDQQALTELKGRILQALDSNSAIRFVLSANSSGPA
jgi:hypothetical protein